MIPRRISHTFAGQAVANPITIPTCIRNQKTGEFASTWCGAADGARVEVAGRRVRHCGAGCTLGDVVAEFAVFGLGATIAGEAVFASMVGDYVLALALGIAFRVHATGLPETPGEQSVLAQRIDRGNAAADAEHRVRVAQVRGERLRRDVQPSRRGRHGGTVGDGEQRVVLPRREPQRARRGDGPEREQGGSLVGGGELAAQDAGVDSGREGRQWPAGFDAHPVRREQVRGCAAEVDDGSAVVGQQQPASGPSAAIAASLAAVCNSRRCTVSTIWRAAVTTSRSVPEKSPVPRFNAIAPMRVAVVVIGRPIWYSMP